MASSSTPSSQTLEGVFAINKPLGISSAQVIRDAQSHFKRSSLFQPWFKQEHARREADFERSGFKKKSRKQRQPLQVKIGHGGTLDPMATGVLILGVGIGTKKLDQFLGCTKSYEAVVLFGAATDSYDAVGKVVARMPYEGATREAVKLALGKFRGEIKQRPPVFSALRVKGKRLYQYAREGKEVPVEIQERDVEVRELEVVEWSEGGTHGYVWPEEQAEREVKDVVWKVLELDGEGDVDGEKMVVDENDGDVEAPSSSAKRKRGEDRVNGGGSDVETSPLQKRPKASPEPMPPSIAPQDEAQTTVETDPAITTSPTLHSTPNTQETAPHSSDPQLRTLVPCPAPAVRLRMTVTSGFYVRSLAHDLGAAVGSVALMASLVRTRQGEFELGGGGGSSGNGNDKGEKTSLGVLEYEDLGKGEEIWGPKVEGMLREWSKREGIEDGGNRYGDDGSIERAPGPGRRRNVKPAARAGVRRYNSSSSEE